MYDNLFFKVSSCINIIMEIMGKSIGAGLSTNVSSAEPTTKSNDFFNEASSTSVGSTSTKAQPNTSSTPTPASSLDDLYADL